MYNWIERKLVFPIYFRYLIWHSSFKKRYWAYRYKQLYNVHSSVVFGKYTEIQFESNRAKLEIAEKVEFRKYCHLLLHMNGNLKIGKGVFFNNYCSISCLGKIEIGENTIIGEAVRIYDHNHKYHYLDGKLNVEKECFTIGTITIGKNCWIGSNVTILNNVEIGDNVIIGAGCIIYKSVASNSIVKSKVELVT
ncbi:acyltransferase [Parasediminibacterium sp. JCM 36343]|uniref:acyltransferase n=1 Tax=Parasediminibacterium sp. JCM 36343 TaxID=3374279 RepID=UPI00397E21E7